MGSTEAQGAAPEKERENGGAWGGAGEKEAMRRRVGREYEMRAGARQLRLYMTSAAGLV